MDELDDRVPCVDDLCTGTLNEAGVCSYCGRSSSGVPMATAASTTFVTSEPATTASAGDRIPCQDDLCTGTINERGACNYCGRAYIRPI